jgi:hypothetical protein
MAANGPAFSILTRAQAPFATYLDGLAPKTVIRFERLISESPRFRRIYADPSAVISRLASESRRQQRASADSTVTEAGRS